MLAALCGLLVFAVGSGQPTRPTPPRPRTPLPPRRPQPAAPVYYGVVDDHRHHHGPDEVLYLEERASDGCDDG